MTDLHDFLSSQPGAAARRDAPYGLIRLRGPDAPEFVHRLCSQDVVGMADSAVGAAAFLNPKGKLLATAWVGRVAGELVLSTHAGTVELLAELLERYHFTEQLEIETPSDLACVEIRGRAALQAVQAVAGQLREDEAGLWLAAPPRHGVETVRWHGPAGAWPAVVEALPQLGDELAEVWRIVAGEALVGADTEPTTLAMEVDLDDHISTTKGCYTGQEIVARIHTYGHVNRRLVRLEVASDAPIAAQTSICDADDGDPVGRIMTSAVMPAAGKSLAMGFLPESLLEDGAELALGAADGPALAILSD